MDPAFQQSLSQTNFTALDWVIVAVYLVLSLIVGLTGFMVYRLRQSKILTIPEFYERRFGRRTLILGGVMLALGGILNMGLFLISAYNARAQL